MSFSSVTNKRRTLWFTAAAAMLGAGALMLHAFNPQPDPPRLFGIFGITPSDGIRVNITNVASQVGVPPGPCKAQIGFVNGSGQTLKTETVTLADGQSASLALTFTEASALDVTAAAFTRIAVRPVISTVPPDPCFTAVSAEVTDAFTGRTNIYAMPQLWAAAPAVAVN